MEKILLERSLSPKQKEILQLTVDGHTEEEICELLTMNRLEVDFHLSNLLKKFNVDNKMRLVRLALEHGMVK